MIPLLGKLLNIKIQVGNEKKSLGLGNVQKGIMFCA
jgi:hypothetical protein